MSESMSAERLAEIEARHTGNLHRTSVCSGTDIWICEQDELLTEVRRLQRENHLLHLSRGSSALVGMD